MKFSYSGVMYEDALATLQRKFGQPHAIVAAHLDKLNTFPALKMHNSENVIRFSSCHIWPRSSFQIIVIQR